ncbi:MAG: ABC transporter substrate-binding protein [Methylococcales bacterium]|nr:ABC transporter substrate-binding protein [Methylococcales bacterium]
MSNLSRRLFLRALATVAVMPLLSKCSVIAEPLAIASHVWSGYELLFLAQREGWLSEQSVTLIETLSATDSMQALISGKVQGAALTLDEVLQVSAQGIPLTCVLVFDVSAGADMVLAKTESNNLTELTGKRIGFEPSSLGALMLYKLLQAANVDKSAIIPVEVDYDQHIAAWNQGQIDIIITFEPVASQLLAQGAYKIFDSRKTPDTIFDVLAVKSDVLKSHASNIKHLIAAHFLARHYFYHNQQDSAYKMAMRMKLSPPDVLNSFRGLNLPNEQANQKYLTDQQSTLLMTANTLSAVMIENAMLTQPDNLQGLVTADFLPKSP